MKLSLESYDRLTTRITNKRVAVLIIPDDMNKKDFELLRRWVDQLIEAETPDDDIDAATESEA